MEPSLSGYRIRSRYEGYPWIVHPDSLHLLNAREEGDLCQVRHQGRDYYGTYHERLGFCGGMGEIRVILRGGQPFFTPESEGE